MIAYTLIYLLINEFKLIIFILYLISNINISLINKYNQNELIYYINIFNVFELSIELNPYISFSLIFNMNLKYVNANENISFFSGSKFPNPKPK